MGPTPEAASAISRAAYVFLYPLVVNYGAAYEMAIDRSPAHAGFGRWRRWRTAVRVPGRAGLAVKQVSCTWLDLGPESMIFMPLPPERGRCATQWVDLWGLTPEGSGVDEHRSATGAPVLITASQDDALRHGVEAEVRSETRLVNVWCTWDLCSSTTRPHDLGAVEEPVVMPLSAYLGRDAPLPPPTSWFRWHDAVQSGPAFWDVAAFALSLTEPHPDDFPILELLEEIGIVAGDRRRTDAFSESVTRAIDIGMYEAIDELSRSASGLRQGGFQGTRRQMDRDYFARGIRALARPRPGHSRCVGLSWAFDRS
jgi:hypothetical protein